MTPLLTLLGLCPIIITLGYLLLCAASPWGTCRNCARHPGRRRTCQRCNGTGMRPRVGWQLYTYARRAYRDGTR
jgi:hypothetical protein